MPLWGRRRDIIMVCGASQYAGLDVSGRLASKCPFVPSLIDVLPNGLAPNTRKSTSVAYCRLNVCASRPLTRVKMPTWAVAPSRCPNLCCTPKYGIEDQSPSIIEVLYGSSSPPYAFDTKGPPSTEVPSQRYFFPTFDFDAKACAPRGGG